MEKIISSRADVATSDDLQMVTEEVMRIDHHVDQLHEGWERYIQIHADVHNQTNQDIAELIIQLEDKIDTLRIALMWTIGTLFCVGAGIIAICIHLIS